MDYKRDNNFIIEEEFLGFFETELNISIKNAKSNVIENCNLNLHYLFSFYDNNLFCRCLDFDMYSHLNLKPEIEKKRLKQSGEDALNDFAKEIISDVSKSLTLNIIDYLETLRSDGKEDFVWYSHEYYWGKYRTIRQERDNHNLNKLFYPDKEIKNFITLDEVIIEKLTDIKEQLPPILAIDISFKNRDAFFNEKLNEKIKELEKSAA